MNDIPILKKALRTIQQLKKLVQEKKEFSFEPIAIVGMSCRLPQAHNLDEFWNLLATGKNIITPLSEQRWNLLQGTKEPLERKADLTYRGGYLEDIAAFDAYFFGISPREALWMDPQQRLLLEVSYEALENAGLPLEQVQGSQTAVFSSLYASQYGHLQTLDSAMDALFLPTGSAVSIAANRLSYLWDLRGPSMVLDTACSSSLIAIHLACLHLQANLCEQALVNAVNINLLPSIHAILAQASMLSPAGQCKTFDAQADGYVQGEGAAAIVLKPLSKALKDQDRIYALILGGAVNQDGKTNGLTAPNGLQQEQLLTKAYATAKVQPHQVSYVECHGTGTFLGDPIEVEALGAALSSARTADTPCYLGAVKTNIGHLEPAAGLVSIIKTALVLHKKSIPPNQNFTSPNPHIPFARLAFKLPKTVEPLPRYGETAVAGVSGFGFGGANAHLVLQEMLPETPAFAPSASQPQQEVFTLSAKSSTSLKGLIQAWSIYLKQHPQLDLAQLCHTLHLRRSHFSYRLALVVRSVDELTQKLNLLKIDLNLLPEGAFYNPEPKKVKPVAGPSNPELMDAMSLAKLYVAQQNIDWHQFEKSRSFPQIDLPGYVWDHKDYWPKFNKIAPQKAVAEHPFQARVLPSPLASQQFEFIFELENLPEIKDSFSILHAGFYVEMLAYALDNRYQHTSFTATEFYFSSPLLVLENQTVTVHLILEPQANGLLGFEFYSSNGQDSWIRHAQGKLASTHIMTAPQLPEISSIMRQHYLGNDQVCYQRIQDMGMPAGDTIRWIKNFWFANGDGVAELREKKLLERNEHYVRKLHPGIIDACIQTLFLLLPPEIKIPFVASYMGELKCFHTAENAKYIYTRIKPYLAEEKKIIGEWFLLDEQFTVLAQCTDIHLSQLNNTRGIEQLLTVNTQSPIDFTLPYALCKEQVQQLLMEQLAAIFSMPVADIKAHHTLHDLGMDSLMALAVMRVIETHTEVSYALPKLMQGPTIEEITVDILKQKNIQAAVNLPEKTADITSWLAYHKPQSDAELRLFCFPYGGGGASIYREWQTHFPNHLEVCPIQLPGRENRMQETPLADIKELIPLLAEQLKPLMDKPFAFFGHSFGSLVAFELTRFLRRTGAQEPEHLFVSAYPDPRVPSKSLDNLLAELAAINLDLFSLDEQHLQRLDDLKLSELAAIFKRNGVVDYSDARMTKSIIQVLLPIFVGDMRIVKSYQYYEDPPLNLPITVFVGQHDTWVLPQDHAGWTAHSAQSCTLEQFPSGHLFVREELFRKKIISVIQTALDQKLLVT
ncbi:MAG: polyketide synthase [Legionella sp. 40-6]|mgnify:CR=1 FL=1|nr:MAG: polyketide synthase [Legionella sp. 40-6]